MTHPCDIRGGYADWECVLEHGHEGDHRDGLDRTFDKSSWSPVIDPKLITDRHAEKVLDGYSSDGEIEIDGVKVAYWKEDDSVWFFNPGDDPADEKDERLLAVFSVERTVVRER